MNPISMFADPLVRNIDFDFSLPNMPDFKGLLTICLGLRILVDNFRPTSAPDAHSSLCVSYSEQVGFALNKADRKSVHREDVERLKSHRVIPTQHVLVSKQI